MKKLVLMLGIIIMSLSVLNGCSSPEGISNRDKKIYIQDMEAKTLTELYVSRPEVKPKIRDAAGYGVFSNVNVNLIFVSAGNGYGVVVDNATGKKTYLKMAMAGIGLGAGLKDFRAVIVFKNKETLQNFVDKGWEFGGQADAAAKSGDKGAATQTAGALNPTMEIYQFTQNGIALQATIAGTRYWKDQELNQP